MPGKRIFSMPDEMRGRSDKIITLRFDRSDTVDLPCACNYPMGVSVVCDNIGRLRVLRTAEVSVGDGGLWRPYPTITWLDGVEEPGQLVTRVAALNREGGISIVNTPNGVFDERLVKEAERRRIYVEYIDGAENSVRN
ncbi:hypothetical protein KJ616_01380 [Patescibacteria group bacterium]|nr:hypothetical protein [Patescibacteria group bacterium]